MDDPTLLVHLDYQMKIRSKYAVVGLYSYVILPERGKIPFRTASCTLDRQFLDVDVGWVVPENSMANASEGFHGGRTILNFGATCLMFTELHQCSNAGTKTKMWNHQTTTDPNTAKWLGSHWRRFLGAKNSHRIQLEWSTNMKTKCCIYRENHVAQQSWIEDDRGSLSGVHPIPGPN